MENSKAYQKVRSFIAFLQELKDMEEVLRTVANAQAELTHMNNVRESHRTQIAQIQAEIDGHQGRLDEAKKVFDEQYQAIKAESESKQKLLTGRVAALSAQVSDLEGRLTAARKDLNDTVNEKRKVIAGLEAEQQQLARQYTSLQEQMARLREQLRA